VVLNDLYALIGLAAVAAEEGGSPLLAQIGASVLGFLVVFFVLKKYAVGQIVSIIDERRETIETGLKRAEDLQKQAETSKQALDERLAGIEAEARARMQELIAEGQRVAQKMQDDSRQQASAMVEKAKENIQIETDKARVALKKEIIDLTILAAEHLIKERLDDDKHKQLIGDFLQRIERN